MDERTGPARLRANLYDPKAGRRRVPGVAVAAIGVLLFLVLYRVSSGTADAVVLGVRWLVGFAWLWMATVFWKIGGRVRGVPLWLLFVALAAWFLVRAALETKGMLT